MRSNLAARQNLVHHAVVVSNTVTSHCPKGSSNEESVRDQRTDDEMPRSGIPHSIYGTIERDNPRHEPTKKGIATPDQASPDRDRDDGYFRNSRLNGRVIRFHDS